MLLCAYIYYFACCFNLILYFLVEEDKTNKNYLTSIAKSMSVTGTPAKKIKVHT